ncbi:MAG: hypothetical protein FJX74_19760 [Armatimonadetes bacterium]|nr:hypothetical protein [Armatimonadota bacterium]
MDAKLPSSQLPAPELDPSAYLARTLDFLRVARRREVFVKVICAADTEETEIAEVARGIAEQDRDVLLVLQPATPRHRGGEVASARRLLALQELAGEHLAEVRVIPQCHRLMGVR